jgi:ADP-ribose pyrophosphatase YjhB (NUDIX family)
MAAGALFVDAAGRPLLVKPTYKDGWDLPGGYVEPGESPLAACSREVAEELGIRPAIGPLLLVDWAPNEREGDKLLFVFDGGSLDEHLVARIALPAGELERYEYVESAALDQRLPERLARRVATALQAQRRRVTLYAEHGQAIEGAVVRPFTAAHGET